MLFVHIPEMNKKISANNGYLDFNKDDYNSMLVLARTAPHPILFDNSKAFILMTFPLTSNNRGLKEPVYIVEIQLSEKALDSSLKASNTYSGSHIVLYDHTMEKCITGAMKNIDYKNILSDIEKNEYSHKEDVITELKN